jgi:hypothetical protein
MVSPFLDDVTEDTNLYDDPDSNIQAIQTDLENEIAAERNNAVPPMNLYSCQSPANVQNNFWTAGPGDGWCGCAP